MSFQISPQEVTMHDTMQTFEALIGVISCFEIKISSQPRGPLSYYLKI